MSSLNLENNFRKFNQNRSRLSKHCQNETGKNIGYKENHVPLVFLSEQSWKIKLKLGIKAVYFWGKYKNNRKAIVLYRLDKPKIRNSMDNSSSKGCFVLNSFKIITKNYHIIIIIQQNYNYDVAYTILH